MKLPDFFGLDIGNHSIKVAQVKIKGETNAELTNIGHIPSSFGVAGLEDETKINEIIDKIKQVREASGISTKHVVAALPEASIFTRLIMLPDLPEDQLEQSLFYEANQYLPIPASDVQLDHIPISKKNVEGKEMIQALLVAAPKKIVNLYIDIVEKAGLELIALETETMATGRSITYTSPTQETVLVLDFGGTGTDLSVIKGRFPIFSQSLGTGSDALTKAIAAEFGLDYNQAEQYKRTYGLRQGQADEKIYNTLVPVMQIIINEVNKTVNYFRAHLLESTPKQIFIVGDGAKLPGLPEYLTQTLGIPAKVTDPVSGLEINGKIKSEVTQLATVGFTVAIGLALKTE